MTDFTFQCSRCQEWHEGLPDMAFDAPLPYAELTEEEKETIATKSEDLCAIRYPDTWLLKTSVHLQPYPQRPRIELEPADHLLSIHQQHGIERATLQEILEVALHPTS